MKEVKHKSKKKYNFFNKAFFWSLNLPNPRDLEDEAKLVKQSILPNESN